MKPVVTHVVLAGPQQPDRPTDLERDLGRLDDEVVHDAPAESAARRQHVHVHRRARQAGHARDDLARHVRRLGGNPHIAALGLNMHRRVHRLHRRVREKRQCVFGLEDPVGGLYHRHGVAVVASINQVIRIEDRALFGMDALDRQVAERTRRPVDVELARRALRMPERVRADRDAGADAHDIMHAGQCLDVGVVAPQSCTERWRTHDDGRELLGLVHVEAVGRRTRHLVGRVRPRQRLADHGELLTLLQVDETRHRQQRRRGDDVGVGQRLAGDGVAQHAATGRFDGIPVDAPALGRRAPQHLACGRADLAQLLPAPAHRLTVAGRLRRIVEQSMHRRVSQRDVAGINAEFLGDQRREAGHDALPHLELVDLHDDPAVRAQLQPRVRLQRRRIVVDAESSSPNHARASPPPATAAVPISTRRRVSRRPVFSSLVMFPVAVATRE